MANEQAELRVLNLTPEGKEVQLNFFFFFLAWISLLSILSLKQYRSSAVVRFPHSFLSSFIRQTVDPFIHG